jgi:gentisate 1,2-dioxygenase
MAKVVLTQEQKEFQKLKRFVDKRFPGAHTEAFESAGSLYYRVVSGAGYAIVDPELMIPPAKTVRQAWTDAKYAAWFSNMIRKSNNAFSDEKIYKKLAKEYGE